MWIPAPAPTRHNRFTWPPTALPRARTPKRKRRSSWCSNHQEWVRDAPVQTTGAFAFSEHCPLTTVHSFCIIPLSMNKPINRRGFVTGAVKATGAAAIFPLLMAELANAAETNTITKADISAASLLAGVSFTEPEREMMLEDVQSGLKAYTEIHELNIPNSVAPALDFNPVLPGMTFETARRPMRLSKAGDLEAPKNLDDAAFYSV